MKFYKIKAGEYSLKVKNQFSSLTCIIKKYKSNWMLQEFRNETLDNCEIYPSLAHAKALVLETIHNHNRSHHGDSHWVWEQIKE
ncbi:UNVERIFIED_CONTAM: hypothetical protein BEN50_13850 [Euhalothece sp. KZN 001]